MSFVAPAVADSRELEIDEFLGLIIPNFLFSHAPLPRGSRGPLLV
jgi:hypothetical protein